MGLLDLHRTEEERLLVLLDVPRVDVELGRTVLLDVQRLG